MATGGFQANRKMVTEHIGKGAHRLVLRGYKQSTGDGHRIATKLGAHLVGMEGYHGGIIHYGYKKFPEVGEVKGMRSVKNMNREFLSTGWVSDLSTKAKTLPIRPMQNSADSSR